jgi:tellurite methyltransferase
MGGSSDDVEPVGTRLRPDPNEYIWGTQPSELAREVSRLLPPGAWVLELGCGEGRDSVFFATCGFKVTGVDVSAAGLHKAHRLARAQGVTIRWVHDDATQLRPPPPL